MDNQKDIEKLSEYEAIVLIDEVDLYLHPKWKYDFVYKLRKMFPKIQFIMTTHSIVTVLGASNDDETVFYKIYKEDGETKVSSRIDDISDYTANVLMTSPLFDLEDMQVRNFDIKARASDDGFIYKNIHSEVRKYMKENPSMLNDDIKEKTRIEIQKRLKQLRKK